MAAVDDLSDTARAHGRGRAPTGRRAVRLLAGARLVTTGGSQAAQVALAYLVYERTGSAAWVSAALVASAGAVGLVGPLSGRLGDRFDRRRVMVAAELAGALGWLLVLLADAPLTLVLAALAATAANAPFKAASSASIPNLVPPDRLAWANGLIATASNAALVAGPLLGGALLGAVGARTVFGLNAVTFLVSAVLIARVPGTFTAPDRTPDRSGAATPTAAEPAGRWRPVLRDRRRRRLYTVTALSFAAFGVTLVADLPLTDHLGGGPVGYALLTTLWGAGAVVGSLAATRCPTRHEVRAVVFGSALMAVSLASITVAPGLVVAIAVGTVGGLGSGMAFTPWFSLLQRAAPDTERSTSFAIAETLEQSAFVAGMVVAGPAIELLGPQAVYLVPGALLAGAAVVARDLTGAVAGAGAAAAAGDRDGAGADQVRTVTPPAGPAAAIAPIAPSRPA